MRQVGDRVVIARHRKEYAATITGMLPSGRFLTVQTDEPYNREGDQKMSRSCFEVYDEFSDGRQP